MSADRGDPIVITGMGLVSPLGCTLETFHQRLAAGQSGVKPMTSRFPTGYQSNLGGLANDFDDQDWAAAAAADQRDAAGRTSAMLCQAASDALRDGGWDTAAAWEACGDGMSGRAEVSGGCGLVVGTTSGAALRWERDLERRLPAQCAQPAEAGQPAVASDGALRDAAASPGTAPDFAFAAPALHHFAAEQLQLTGPCQLVASTCASGNHALAWARDLLRAGAASAMLAVGVDTIGHVVLQGFCRLLLQAPVCIQPFDKHRKGTILAEGAGALLLERLSAARARGARIWAELAGCGLSCDDGGAFKGSVRDVDTLLQAGRAALRDAALAPEQIDYVSAHGSGTKLNDARETHFLHQLLGLHAASTPIGALKSMLGHAQGAAASLEAIAGVLSLHHNVLYPTINYRTPDPRCDLDCVPNHARGQRINTVLSNAFGLGGNNALVVLRRWEDA